MAVDSQRLIATFGDWVSPYVDCVQEILQFHSKLAASVPKMLIHAGTTGDARLVLLWPSVDDAFAIDTTLLSELSATAAAFQRQGNDAVMDVQNRTITYHLVQTSVTSTMMNMATVTTHWPTPPPHVARTVKSLVNLSSENESLHPMLTELVSQYVRNHPKTAEFDVEIETSTQCEVCILLSGTQQFSARFGFAAVRTPSWRIRRVISRGTEIRFVLQNTLCENKAEGATTGVVKRTVDRLKRMAKFLKPY